MFFKANTARFLFTVTGPATDFQVLRFSGEEYISNSFEFRITLVCEDNQLDLAAFLYQTCCLTIKTPDGVHEITGVVHDISQGDTGLRLTEYQITLKPRLDLLRYRVNYRIYQQVTVRQIVEQLLQEAGFTTLDYHWRLNEPHSPRDYCVQYAESDYDFMHRILSEAGIHYHYESRGGQHCLVLGDANAAFPNGISLDYVPGNGLNPEAPALRECQTFWRTVSGKVSARDYTFLRPAAPLHSEVTPGAPAQNDQTQFSSSRQPSAQMNPSEMLEEYRWPSLSTTEAENLQQAKLAQARHLQTAIELQGVTDHGGLRAGTFTRFNALPRREFEPLWLIRQVHHAGEQPQVLEETSGGEAHYHNEFIAIPWQTLFVPQWWQKRPKLPGYQTAIVTGPKGEEIYTDADGRIKVQFHWDREGQADEKTSCWLRIAQSWAGNGYGNHWIPRVGQEVVVSFEHGNPDRPLVLGCVYNGANALPYALPAHKTRTVFKTLSTPGGGGFNELRFEDKKQHEQIYLHAQRNWELMVKANAYATIDGDSHRLTQGNAIERVRHDRHETVQKDSFEELNADDQLKLKGLQQMQVDHSFFVRVGDEIHHHAGVKINMQAGAGLTLKVGGSFISLSPDGVQMVAPAISLKGGAAPLQGPDPNLVPVQKPVAAVVAEARKQKAAASKTCRRHKP